jgi:hypothetical protein
MSISQTDSLAERLTKARIELQFRIDDLPACKAKEALSRKLLQLDLAIDLNEFLTIGPH